VNFAFDEEQEALRETVRKFLADTSPETEVRRLMETAEGYNPDVWRQLAGQLGLVGLIVPEEYGGAGFTYLELIVVFEEMGRSLLCAPFFSTVAMATTLLLALDDDAGSKDLLPRIADGSCLATVALAESAGSWNPADVAMTAVRDGSGRGGAGWTLSGEKFYVVDGHVANVVLVVARTEAGPSVFAVGSGAAGLAADLSSTMDKTRKLARLTFDATPAWLIGVEGQADGPVARMLDLAAIALAAEQVGGAQRVLEIAVGYANIREQFGRPIGTFQAIKHKCANMLLEIEAAKSAAYYAGWAAAEDDAELPVLASVAKAYCSDAYVHAAAENIQIHGGIGFTWEHPAHLYFKRAKSSELFLGAPDYHRERLLQGMGI
jgi:alkylation response protein AidB-like acyl-CoA dehydrogenase